MPSTDVLIVGCGLVGGTLACLLASHGVRVVVIDASPPPERLDPALDGRWSALAEGSRILLDRAGLWPALEPSSQAITDIRVCDAFSPLVLDFGGIGALGHMVENRSVRVALADRLATLAAATVRAPARLSTLERGPYRVTATLDDGERVDAALVVGADGRGSQVRALAGIGTRARAYDQTAIVQTIAHEESHDGLAVELFLPGGPFATLPLPGNHSLIVWSERAALVPGLLAADPAVYQAELAQRVGEFLGDITPVGRPQAFPLALHLAHRLADTRLALVGDAGHGMHPVAGQGFNFGLRDVAALAELLIDAHRLGQDPGAPALTEAYSAWRRPDTALMLALTDGLVRLFSNTHPVLTRARRLGLASVNRLAPLKDLLTTHARGTQALGRLPRLMRP
ncbi:UbiH/UbiF/VisC/COQ6 family ubiquinone biosynthesis hydroxylase [Pararhodospirillum oryzae]|uniref:2-octaprenyl-3-methyl-6-methoxy-1,4-benzoquinol hydroxylase n=1 Tax=Pararhodospirillum oryzae TaxID=478448 RepID=A0A512H8K4_9PROT|nr:UbiH/UbiF/VisC/COQ6 family ubiquinone biosynthesis hydroxylase [Pararhodospirillum oryzae]GEO81783.1 2-octaprenyl-3-methyl-6-methoxy-1,4-benzoquinol hydroxylase [Pararhodospirillum oryzae]